MLRLVQKQDALNEYEKGTRILSALLAERRDMLRRIVGTSSRKERIAGREARRWSGFATSMYSLYTHISFKFKRTVDVARQNIHWHVAGRPKILITHSLSHHALSALERVTSHRLVRKIEIKEYIQMADAASSAMKHRILRVIARYENSVRFLSFGC